jgi:hypothetical protein
LTSGGCTGNQASEARAAALRLSFNQASLEGGPCAPDASTSVGSEKNSIEAERGEAKSSQPQSSASATVSPLIGFDSGNEAQCFTEGAPAGAELETNFPRAAITLGGSQNVINGGTFTAVGRDVIYNIQTSEEHSKLVYTLLQVASHCQGRCKAQEDAEMAVAAQLSLSVRGKPGKVDVWHRCSLPQKRRVSEMASW